MSPIRMAQYGTKHGHAEGKLDSMLRNPEVEVAGIFEPDQERRAAVQGSKSAFGQVHWFESVADILEDPSIVAVSSEGRNDESLDHTEALVQASKHVWYDKPAGDNWPQWQRIMAQAVEKKLLVQMGYMFRYHRGFQRIAEWVHSGFLGDVFSVRAHMSTHLSAPQREVISVHNGGILFDLGGHMLDQVVWLLGRPTKVTAFLRNDSGIVPAFKDNTLGVFEFPRAIATVDIAAMESRPMARRFEVYGTLGSAIITEPFEPATQIRLCLESAAGGYGKGEQFVPVQSQSRQETYDLELEAFVATIQGKQAPDRTPEHELRVQETLLRATGGIP